MVNHLVLARKYRPRLFDEVVGQDHIVVTLKAAIEKKRTAHALLFSGGRGTGKTSIARIVAKALVCDHLQGANPCGQCVHCVSIDHFSSLDVIEIDGASHTGVDDIRDLRDNARYQPASARMKIFIIDEVHMLSTSAFNALLKILEEPPPHVVFIFATTEVHKIPKTILSRCQRYDFRRMNPSTIFLSLKQILSREEISIEDQGLHEIAKLADGSLRDALSLIEQIISTKESHYSAAMIADRLGIVSHQAVKEILLAILEQHIDDALHLVKQIYDKGLDLCQLMDAICARARTLSLAAHVDETRLRSLIDTVDDEMLAVVKAHDKADLKRIFAMALDAMPSVFHATKPLYALELFLLRAALRPPLGDALSISYCLNKLDAIMHNRPLVRDKPSTNPDQVFTKFMQFVDELDGVNKILATHFRHARAELSPEALCLTFMIDFHYEGATQRCDSKAKAVFAAHFGDQLELRFLLDKKVASTKEIKTIAEDEEQKQKQAEQANWDRAKVDPLVKSALAIFGGDITSVKRINPADSANAHPSISPGPRAE